MSTTTPNNDTAPSTMPKPIHIYDPDLPCLIRASDHEPAPIKWLWPGRIPLGSITLLAGDPGAGKSLFAADLAARVSRGSAFPAARGLAPSATTDTQNDATPNDAMPNDPNFDIRHSDIRHSSPGSVIILSATDQFHDTILPRLAAAGADQSRVYVLQNITNLRTEMENLRDVINAAPDLKLLVLDPINFYVGPGDAHFQTVVRTVLQPLAELARKKNFAILAITHFRKNDGQALLQRTAGSMGFVSTARTIWTITQDPEDESRRYLIPLKNNLTAPVSPLAFKITTGEMTNDECPRTNEQSPAADSVIRHSVIRHSPPAPHLKWDPAARGLAHPHRKPRRPTQRDEAKRFLESALADGPQPAEKLFDEADARGITRRTVQRAFHELDGHTTKKGFRAGWWWSLGEHPIAPIPESLLENLDPLAAPTYAEDIAAQITLDRLHDDVARTLAKLSREKGPLLPHPRPAARGSATPNSQSEIRNPKSPHSPPPAPTSSVSPSPKPAKTPPTPPKPKLSPSPEMSPSSRPPSKSPPGPLRPFMPQHTRPRPKPKPSCQPDTRNPTPNHVLHL